MNNIKTIGGLESALTLPTCLEGDIAQDCKGVKVCIKNVDGQMLPFKVDTDDLYKRSENDFIEKIWRNGELIWEYQS